MSEAERLELLVTALGLKCEVDALRAELAVTKLEVEVLKLEAKRDDEVQRQASAQLMRRAALFHRN